MAGRPRGPTSDVSGGQEHEDGQPKFEIEIGMLIDMGFQRSAVVAAIISSKGDVEMAAAMLCSAAAFEPETPISSPQVSTSPTPAATLPAAIHAPTVWGNVHPPQPTRRKAPPAREAANNGALLTAFHTYTDRSSIEETVGMKVATTARTSPRAAAHCDDGFVERPAHLNIMKTHKIQKCKNARQHEFNICSCWHYDKDRRRNPYEIPYTTVMCTAYPNCPEGDACMDAHNLYEVMFHPDCYKMMLCKALRACRRDNLICAFCHGDEDSRHPNHRHKRVPPTPRTIASATADEMPALKPAAPTAVKTHIASEQRALNPTNTRTAVYANSGAYDMLEDFGGEEAITSRMMQQLAVAPRKEKAKSVQPEQHVQPTQPTQSTGRTIQQPPVPPTAAFEALASDTMPYNTDKAQPPSCEVAPDPAPAAAPAPVMLETLSPTEYICPLTKRLMSDPVIAADGETYERQAIEQYLSKLREQRKAYVSPLTGERLPDAELTPNMAIKILIQTFQLAQG